MNRDTRRTLSENEAWLLVRSGQANESEKLHAIEQTRVSNNRAFVSDLVVLLEDFSADVREYALKVLSVDLGIDTPALVDQSWAFLRSDPDEDVRCRAAAAIGRALSRQPTRAGFSSLLRELKNPAQPVAVRGAIYRALFPVAGWKPDRWPFVRGPAQLFREADIDWHLVAELEDSFNDRNDIPDR